MVPVELVRIIVNETRGDSVIILQETGGARAFPIVIGYLEAFAIKQRIEDIDVKRPLTHDLAASLIKELGASITRVLVNDLEDNTFYARIYLAKNGTEIEVDSRPSDAIALAVRFKAPLFVENAVFEKLGASS